VKRPVLKTALCERLGIEYPICLAGMGSRGKATPPRLVAAVAEAGGLGMIGGSGIPAEELRSVIREVRTMTRKPIGVDLLLPATLAAAPPTRSAVRREMAQKYPKHVEFVRKLVSEHGLPDVYVENEVVVTSAVNAGGSKQKSPHEEQIEVILQEDVQVFAAGLRDPSSVVPVMHKRGMTVIRLAGTVRNGQRQIAAGVDIVVSQGYEAGGHTGSIANFALIPQMVDVASPRPVIAAGGISDGRGIAAALALGAQGAWIGTAFLVSDECAIPDLSKDQIVKGGAQDFVISRVYTGKPMRTFRNDIINAWSKAGLEPLPMPYQKVLMDDFNEAASKLERDDLRSNPAGQGAGLITKRRPAREIMQELVEGTITSLGRLHTSVTMA